MRKPSCATSGADPKLEWIWDGFRVEATRPKSERSQDACIRGTVARSALDGICRSAVINPERIGAIEKTRWGSLVVRLQSGAQIPVGRKFRAEIQAFTSEGAGG